jgi:hypothetical protein
MTGGNDGHYRMPLKEQLRHAMLTDGVLPPPRDLEAVLWDQGPGPHVHDWRTYVPHHLQCLWPSLPDEARLCVFWLAETQASREEWE